MSDFDTGFLMGDYESWPISIKNKALADAVFRDDHAAIISLVKAGANGTRNRNWLGLEAQNIYEVAIEVGASEALLALIDSNIDPYIDFLNLSIHAMRFDQKACLEILIKSEKLGDELKEELFREMISRGVFKETIGSKALDARLGLETIQSLHDFAELLGRDEHRDSLAQATNGISNLNSR